MFLVGLIKTILFIVGVMMCDFEIGTPYPLDVPELSEDPIGY